MKKTLKNLLLLTVIIVLCIGVAVMADAVTYSSECDHDWREMMRHFDNCEIGGTIEYMCYNCEQYRSETIEPKEHDWKEGPDPSTFCGTLKGDLPCKNINCYGVKYVEITGTLEHKWQPDYDDALNSRYSCTEGGEVHYRCLNDRCQDSSKVEYTAPIGAHDWMNYPTDDELKTFCGEKYYPLYCNRCKRGVNHKVTGTKEHDIGWTSNGDATCTEDGTKSSYCNNCDIFESKTVTDAGTALGHNYNAYVELTDVSCTQDGVSVRSCKRCAKIDVNKEEAYGHMDKDEDGKCDECKVIIEIYAPNDPSVPAAPPAYPGEPDDSHTVHILGEWVTEKEATCSAEGSKHMVCTVCGETVKTESIAKLNHSYNAVVTEATCEKGGYTTYTCACGDTYTGNQTPATGHNYSDGVCTECGEKKDVDCSCNCHKGGFSGFIWKILRFFYKLFKSNKICSCGVAHY